jgi:hypothetical protein
MMAKYELNFFNNALHKSSFLTFTTCSSAISKLDGPEDLFAGGMADFFPF